MYYTPVLHPRQAVEMFHLVFLRALVAKAGDKQLFALKGGCNLRFYFGSVRYSEDIDLDAVVIGQGTLENKVNTLLASPVITHPLKAHGFGLVEVTTPKQTATTQRWKAGLWSKGLPAPIRTKIEFSRRDQMEGTSIDAVDAERARSHSLPPFLATHYPAERAALQKILALAGRAHPQARDVFDLNLLLARPETTALRLPPDVRGAVPTALEQAMSIGFDDYASAVVAFLEPEHVEIYGDPATWDLMQANVVERIQHMAAV